MDIKDWTQATIEKDYVEPPTLAHLLSAWPILECIATHTAVGDLIMLARTSSNIRAIMHGGLPNERNRLERRKQQLDFLLRPQIGQHQTPFWISLKSKSSFICSRKSHTRGNKTQACVYCSIPICEACIVRDSFNRRNENTFRNRFRYLCQTCWSLGKPVKSFRYSHQTAITSNRKPPMPTDMELVEGFTDAIEDLCSCTLKENGWLCLDCKMEQNSSPLAMNNLQTISNGEIACFGFMCSRTIKLSNPEKDRWRICLWCEKSLKRQFGSEDCHRRHVQFSEICAANASHRLQELKEFDERQMRYLDAQKSKISRNELHSTDVTGNNALEPIRDLDLVNYRNYLDDLACPSSESIWKSKMGIWRYDKQFLLAIGRFYKCSNIPNSTMTAARASELHELTRDGSSPFARTNASLNKRWDYDSLLPPSFDDVIFNSRVLEVLKVRILDFYFRQGLEDTNNGLEKVQYMIQERYGCDIRLQSLQIHIKFWTKPSELKLTNVFGDRIIDTENGEKLLPTIVNIYHDLNINPRKYTRDESDEEGASLDDDKTLIEGEQLDNDDSDRGEEEDDECFTDRQIQEHFRNQSFQEFDVFADQDLDRDEDERRTASAASSTTQVALSVNA